MLDLGIDEFVSHLKGDLSLKGYQFWDSVIYSVGD